MFLGFIQILFHKQEREAIGIVFLIYSQYNCAMYIVFPGQGSQKSQMGLPFANNSIVAKNVAIASEITKKNVKYLIEEMPIEELNQTENAQIAIFVLSYSLFLLFKDKLAENKLAKDQKISEIKAMAGHSLGEYTAICAAGILSFEDTCVLINERSKLMQQVKGSMAACLNISPFEANMIALIACDIEQNELCFVANYNSTTQIVLSGHDNAIKRAQELMAKLNKKAIILPTSGPFHTPYMRTVAQKMELVIDNLQFNAPIISVISNMYASAIDWASDGKNTVKQHMIGPVRWQETMAKMKDDKIIEIGATSLLMSMAKRDRYDIEYWSIYE